jgi:hypothetical protein
MQRKSVDEMSDAELMAIAASVDGAVVGDPVRDAATKEDVEAVFASVIRH